jgi:hypothetical protein
VEVLAPAPDVPPGGIELCGFQACVSECTGAQVPCNRGSGSFWDKAEQCPWAALCAFGTLLLFPALRDDSDTTWRGYCGV